MTEKPEPKGLFGTLLQGSPLSGLGISPRMIDKDIVIEMTQEQLRALLLQNADQRARDSVSLELHEGKLTLRIRLW